MPKRKTADAKFEELTQHLDIERLRKSIRDGFSDFPDPRRTKSIDYPAWYLILVILCGYLAGGNTISDIAHFAELKKHWLDELTGISRVPSYDTIWWFLVRTDPNAFKTLIIKWLKSIPHELQDQLLVIDGKRLRGISTSEHITHLVELFASESRLTLAQEKVPNKAGERIALPALLDTVDVQGAIVSMDALYAHVTDIQEVLQRGADYIVGIKGNQGHLEAEVENFFRQANDVNFEGIKMTQEQSQDKGHGRKEQRRVTVIHDLDWLPQKDKWKLQSLIEVRSERLLKGVKEQSVRYYGSSRKTSANNFSKWIREHWSIENSLHYVLDVIFDEDASKSDIGNSAENISLIRRFAMNIVRSIDPDRGMANARRCAAYEPRYLSGLLGKVFC